jgi:hypothetical protein
MIRTQIQLPEAEYEALKDRARREDRSMADCVREAIAQYLVRSAPGEADFAAVAGRFAPLPGRGLKRHDRDLADSILQPDD